MLASARSFQPMPIPPHQLSIFTTVLSGLYAYRNTNKQRGATRAGHAEHAEVVFLVRLREQPRPRPGTDAQALPQTECGLNQARRVGKTRPPVSRKYVHGGGGAAGATSTGRLTELEET